MPIGNIFNPNVSLSGDLIVGSVRPVVQCKFAYNLNTDIVSLTTTGSGTTTQADSQAVLQTTAATNSSATLNSIDPVSYQPGQATVCRFTALFSEGMAGSTQQIGIGDDTDGFFIGYNGADFGVLHRKNGTDSWTKQSDFNGPFKSSPLSRATDATLGNVYQIEYQWLGYGSIKFSIYNKITNTYELIHSVDYPNTQATPHTYNPSLPVRGYVANTTNNTNITLKTASMAALSVGDTSSTPRRKATNNTKNVTSEVNILTIRSNATHQSKTNRSLVIPRLLSIGADGTKITTFNVYKNATLGGTPSFSDIDADTSVVAVDTAGTTVTGGEKLLGLIIGKEDGAVLNLKDLGNIRAGETLTVSATSTSTTSATAILTWKELQ
jgi:hypothetical protein